MSMLGDIEYEFALLPEPRATRAGEDDVIPSRHRQYIRKDRSAYVQVLQVEAEAEAKD